jgi:hypothetical protein
MTGPGTYVEIFLEDGRDEINTLANPYRPLMSTEQRPGSHIFVQQAPHRQCHGFGLISGRKFVRCFFNQSNDLRLIDHYDNSLAPHGVPYQPK